MKKLKIKLLFKILFVLVFIIYIYVFNTKLIYKTDYKLGNNYINGTIIDINKKDGYTDLIVKAKDKIKVTYLGTDSLAIGDIISFDCLLELPSNNTIFNLFNYKKYLLSNRIYYVTTIKNLKIEKHNNFIIYKVKNYIYSRVDNLKSSSYLKAFILGDKTTLNTDIKEIYSLNGTSHLLAISGMHISLLALILSKVFKFKGNNILISLFLIFYLFLINFTPSAIRAVSSFIFSKYIDSKKLIFIILIIMLLYNPFYINNTGFIFSFVISIYLIYFKDKINGNYIVKTLKISLISFLVSIPILINTYNSINLISPFINVLVVPFVSMIIFPLSIITLLIPFFDNILYVFIIILENVSIFLNKFSINISLCSINIILIFLYYVIITLTIYKPKMSILLLFMILIHTNRFFLNDSFITMLDVKQGDSIFLKLENKSILIDTGGYYNSNIIDNRTIPYLKSIGISKLNYLILTHGDYDHMGEAINLINNFKVDKVIFNCGGYNDLEKELIKVLEKKNIKYYSCIKELNIDNNKLYFLQTKEYDNENDNSNAIYTELNGYKFMFMGDAGVDKEKDILDKYNISDIDVLKVGHHGSSTSSSKYFIDTIKPKYGLISVGKNNKYNHPNKEVLNTLGNSKIYRTDKDGSIEIKLKRNRYKIRTCMP